MGKREDQQREADEYERQAHKHFAPVRRFSDAVRAMSACERCDNKPSTDYCAYCLMMLCADCMARGCCKTVPAVSGEAAARAETKRIEQGECPF